ncbi:hypothetical protein Pmani_017747 [Petrolisthes manimaculis]|uniref:Tyrosine-protein kinase n=1 Tax=Petrolisthes manimaculis TaxID=1843537 RepID=A0AAE1PME2_9EUCA|nr:hypothetical protein Pmani_017747 [Petrolisthes manimaculis]
MNTNEKNIWKKDENTGYEIYEALYDYKAVTSGDLTFCQGDELEVVEEPASGEQWLRAQNKTTGMVGYVPSNFIKKKGKENRVKPLNRPFPFRTSTNSPFATTNTTKNQPQQQLPNSSLSFAMPNNTPSPLYTNLPSEPSHLTPSTTTTPSTTGQTYVALYDFSAIDSDGVSFKRGDRLMVQEGTEGMGGGGLWWYGTVWPLDASDSQVGFVPKNYFVSENDFRAQPWYAGGVTRQESVALLLNPYNTTGAFLVRDSQSTQGYSLSVRDKGEVKHYLVKEGTLGTNKHYYVKESQVFSDINHIIQHYQHNDGLCVRLTQHYKSQDNTRQQLEEERSHQLEEEKSEQPEWEIDRNTIKLDTMLGSGNFGEVWKGTWATYTQVAVKKIKDECMEVEEFKREYEVMRCLRHPRLVKVYGLCSRPTHMPLYIVTELVKHGALLDHLRKRKNEKLPHPTLELLSMGVQVSGGMAYLEERKFVHRDLAARNVLIGDKIQVKIADFGMARVIKEGFYEKRSHDGLPVKWTAPEALDHRFFTTKSDVWSFGILLFEIFTHGETPYSGMSNKVVREKLKALYRIPKPLNCPLNIYSVMVRCWMQEPEARPSFRHIKEELEPLLAQSSTTK